MIDFYPHKCTIAILAIFFCCLGYVQAQRDPYKYPFSKTSIWNMPIHNSAVYVPAGIPAGTAWGVTYDQEIILNTPTAPSQQVYTNGWATVDRCSQIGGSIGTINVPDNYVTPFTGSTPNMSASVLQSDGQTYYNTQPLHRCVANGPAYSKYNYPSSNIYGNGIAGAHGGSGMSAVGGSIRVGELIPGGVIRHAIKVELWEKYLSFNNGGYRWPAAKADACAVSCYLGNNTALKMGSLLALPPGFNINSLNTEPGRILAKAMKDYGAYVVDVTGWDVTQICTSEGPDGSVVDNFAIDFGFPFNPSVTSGCSGNSGPCLWSKDVATIFTNLNVVNNNDANNIGGGLTTDFGNRRVSFTCDPTGTVGSGSWCSMVNVPVTGVSVSPISASVAIGLTTTLTATLIPADATNQTINWSSNNTGVATINSSGIVSGVATGTVTITATSQDGSFTSTSTITVTSNSGSSFYKLGDTTILPSPDNGNSTCLHSQPITLNQTLTINSLSIYCQSAGGNVILAIYDELNGKPNTLVATTASFIPIAGQWNTQNVLSPVSLAAGNYWIAFQCSSDVFTTTFQSAGRASYSMCSHVFGATDATFPTGNLNQHAWNVYGTFSLGSVVPLTGLIVQANKEGNAVIVKWKTFAEVGTKYFSIEKSYDGVHFIEIGQTTATGNAGSNSYSLPDIDNITENIFYRIRAVDQDGRYSVSNVVVVKTDTKETLTITGNPVKNKVINIQLANSPKGRYLLKLISPLGQIVIQQTFDFTSTLISVGMPLPGGISKGIYILLANGPNIQMTQRCIIE